MEPRPAPGQFRLEAFGFVKRLRMDGDPQHSVGPTRFRPEVQQGMQQQEAEAHERARQLGAGVDAAAGVDVAAGAGSMHPMPEGAAGVGRAAGVAMLQGAGAGAGQRAVARAGPGLLGR